MIKTFKRIALLLVALPVLALLALFIYISTLSIDPPTVPEMGTTLERTELSSQHIELGNNWLMQDPSGIWVVYVEGSPYERGLAYGELCQELIHEQEVIFVDQIEKMLGDGLAQSMIKHFVVWFNRNMEEHIPLEYQQEIYGVSQSFSSEFDWVAPKYHRVLNYHAAHDIGHALKDLAIVGCSSFSVRGPYSADSTLLVGRNFDFYMGPEFAKQRLVTINKPDSGLAYISYSWAGMMGVVSGMNENGLCVTINAASSEMPTGAKDPISLVAREVLQYASTIDEAYKICKKREVFVSEILMVTSATDGRSALIEVSPNGSAILDPATDTLFCTNHYQSVTFANSETNLLNIQTSDSKYRYELLETNVLGQAPLEPSAAAAILSNPNGEDGKHIGFGNPKAINQMIGHHSVIFKPEEGLVWFSAWPDQLAGYHAFDLNALLNGSATLTVDSLRIESQPFFNSEEWNRAQRYKVLKHQLLEFTLFDSGEGWNAELEKEFLAVDPQNFNVHMLLGQYHLKLENLNEAEVYFQQALKCELPSLTEEKNILALLDQCHD